MRIFPLLFIVLLLPLSAAGQYIYNISKFSDIVVVGTVVRTDTLEGGWVGRRDGRDMYAKASMTKITVNVSRYLFGAGESQLSFICPARYTSDSGSAPPRIKAQVGTTAVWFVRSSSDGSFYEDLPSSFWRGGESKSDRLYHLDGASFGQAVPAELMPQIVLKDPTMPNRGNMFLDIAEALVLNAKLDPERRWYYFENLTDLSPFGFGSEDRSKLEQDMFKNWMDAHLHEALNPATDAELMDEYALRIRFGQFEYCDKFTDMFVRTKGIGMTANFPLTLGTNENGLRVYAVAEPRLARELALGFMYCAELSRRRDICKQLIARFDEDHLLDVGILEAVSKLMDWPDVSPYESETHRAFGDLSTQIEIARFRLNN